MGDNAIHYWLELNNKTASQILNGAKKLDASL